MIFRVYLLAFLSLLSSLVGSETSTSYWWSWWDTSPSFPPTPKTFNLNRVTDLEQILNQRVVGQPWPVRAVSNAMVAYRAQIHDPNRPIGCFLFVGSSGVGKTELAKALAKEIASNPQQFIHLNMSEYNNDRIGLDRLIGVPYGYINNEKGGELSNAILKNPYSVVLLDEFEKADVHAKLLFLHIFDEGYFKSGRGEYVDCRNCIFIATTNAGAYEIERGWVERMSPEEMLHFIQPKLISAFSPELYNRMEPVVFQKLSDFGLMQIIHLKLKETAARVYQNRHISLLFDDSVTRYIFERCAHLNRGARPILGVIKNDVLPIIAKAMIDNTYTKDNRLLMVYDQQSLQISKL